MDKEKKRKRETLTNMLDGLVHSGHRRKVKSM